MNGYTHFSLGVERYRVVGAEDGPVVQTYNGKDWVRSDDRKANAEVMKMWGRGR